MHYKFSLRWVLVMAVICLPLSVVQAADEADKAVRASDEQLAKLFDAAKANEIAALFMADGELIDENGTVYQGRDELKQIFSKFFEKFPGAKLSIQIESVRTIGGGLVIEEGTRLVTTKEHPSGAQTRYTAVRAKVDGQWQIASFREFNDDPPPTPNERLQALAWLIGDWVNEGGEANVKISYRWSEDKNYLLGEYEVHAAGKPQMKSSQRIGWDPVAGKVRSWLFEADGGFSEGSWTAVEEGWLVKSTSTLSDGQTGSATLTFVPKGKDHFILRGADRVIGDDKAPDFEVTCVKKVVAAAAPMDTKRPATTTTPATRKEN
jgi:uncharacterized protein (TIGR02246 family)